MHPFHKVFAPISIHAPREGCDAPANHDFFELHQFQSTHPARGATGRGEKTRTNITFQSTHPARGATSGRRYLGEHQQKFQSTHPARGATARSKQSASRFSHFNPRTPRGVRPAGHIDIFWVDVISIHAPREGCDYIAARNFANAIMISIHAPREGCDTNLAATIGSRNNFNPRTPRGVRLFDFF